jgi:excisionase family DNA binding protein
MTPAEPAMTENEATTPHTCIHSHPYLSVEQACRLLQIGRSTFYRILADEGSGLADVAIRIPGVGRLRFPERKLRRWLEGHSRRGGTPRHSP